MTENLFNPAEFARMVRYQMFRRRQKQHEVCEATGISRPTLCRVLAGKHEPSVESYLRLKRWAESALAAPGDGG